MQYISDAFLERCIEEDVPYFDLTTRLLGLEGLSGSITILAREDCVVCATEEVCRIFEKLGITNDTFLPSGTIASPGQVVLQAHGPVENLHQGWKVAANLLEHASGVATRTRRLIQVIKEINPQTELITTRKLAPGNKELMIKAIVSGGALPHRLGLSETVLIFKQHLSFYGGYDVLCQTLQSLQAHAVDKFIVIEAENETDTLQLCRAGAQCIQLDKIKPDALKVLASSCKEINPAVKLIATGGINGANIAQYAATGVDAISTSCVYYGSPVDFGVKIER